MIIHNSLVFCYTPYQGYRREVMDSHCTPLPRYGPNMAPCIDYVPTKIRNDKPGAAELWRPVYPQKVTQLS